MDLIRVALGEVFPLPPQLSGAMGMARGPGKGKPHLGLPAWVLAAGNQAGPCFMCHLVSSQE